MYAAVPLSPPHVALPPLLTSPQAARTKKGRSPSIACSVVPQVARVSGPLQPRGLVLGQADEGSSVAEGPSAMSVVAVAAAPSAVNGVARMQALKVVVDKAIAQLADREAPAHETCVVGRTARTIAGKSRPRTSREASAHATTAAAAETARTIAGQPQARPTTIVEAPALAFAAAGQKARRPASKP